MSNSTLTEEQIEQGLGCQKGMPGCYCGIGWPLERMCPDCRDQPNRDRGSYCVCGPVLKRDRAPEHPAVALLREIQWGEYGFACPVCRRHGPALIRVAYDIQFDAGGHAPDCRLAAILASGPNG